MAYGIDWGFSNDPTAIIAVFGSGNSLNVPIDNFNHVLDAVRYVVVNRAFVRKKRMVGVRTIRL